MPTATLADHIDALLPQTQCTKCGYEGCRPYAAAIAHGEADINRCPPGGESGVRALAALLGTPSLPLDTSRGTPGPLTVAVIDETHCIGCTLCIDACPVDAIVGTAKRMHTVVEALCTGCDLCVAPCPVDCIVMVPSGRDWTTDDARRSRDRHERRARRLQEDGGTTGRRADRREPAGGHPAPAASVNAGPAPMPATLRPAEPAPEDAAARRRAAIDDALARARARRLATPK
ncbi:electron transport complex subunit RsxB [Bordetella flabilis]|uniref:Ferredoxin n=1 Tax=Bordetella flabilis TaxID=463014 RepID=A0A193GKG5_9BORD|nr:electron transport complex subunit RsxB [Bordetella flabilis]ANN80592.1 ferredoxin [Bordetella flabilis]